MLFFRAFLLVMMFMTLPGSDAGAYPYSHDPANPYGEPHAGYSPYAHAPRPHYRAYRQPLQPAYPQARQPAPGPAGATASAKLHQSATGKHSNGPVAVQSAPVEKTAKRASGATARKQKFTSTLLPYIEEENNRLLALRQNVAGLFGKLENNTALSASEQQHIKELAKKYRLDGNPLQDRAAREEMLQKIDIIPSSLALAQAVNESAWGESRFAQEANNLFGIWTYDEDKGLKPKHREEGKTHLVRIFDDFGESVRYYMYLLNSHPAYEELREIRHRLRASRRVIDGHELAAGLEKYSAKGQAYIELIRGLIRQNEWAGLDTHKQQA
jgi:Bax protein